MNTTFRESLSGGRNRSIFRGVLLTLTSLAALGALVFPIGLRPTNYQLVVGDVAPQDIQAPSTLTYTSEVLTLEAQEAAAQMVAPVFLPADPAITRHQIERLRISLGYISNVRLDSYATNAQKIADLAALQDISLPAEIAEAIITLPTPRWEVVQAEALVALEQTMRTTIREDQVKDAQVRVPQLISFAIPEDQAEIVTGLVTPFVVANSLHSVAETEAQRTAARAAVSPVSRSYKAGEIIVRRGQVITKTVMESLQQYGLIQTDQNYSQIWAAVALVAALTAFIILYFERRYLAPIEDLRGLLVSAVLFLIFLYSGKLLITNHIVVPYIFPIAAFGMTIGSLYAMEVGLIFSLILSILTAYGMSSPLDLTLFYILTSFCGVLVLGKARRISSFFTSGIAIGLVGSATILAYRLPDSITDWIGIATLMGSAVINGMIAASLTLIFHYLLSQLLRLTTALQLLDLSRPDHPLMQYILKNAPGTYQHSLQVANLAEQAAEAIGADALLTRLGAIYHDAGKALNPAFFVENQVPGNINSHDDLDPAESASIIIRHIPNGVAIARQYRLPPRLLDFMREHHGTLITRYQYSKAVQAAGNDPGLVDINHYRYPGPRPRSKETALLMLADGVEARARANLPQGEEQLRELIKGVIEFCRSEGQLDDTNFTMHDLSTVTESFVNTLRNTYHPRIKYPEIKVSKSPLPDDNGDQRQALSPPTSEVQPQ